MLHVFLLALGLFAILGQAHVPLVIASHKLVPNFRSGIDQLSEISVSDATNLIKKLVTECSSDQYVFLEIPGLKYTDLNEYSIDSWPFLTTYLKLASTNLGLSFVSDVLDLNFIEKYTIKTCEAETINVEYNDDGNVAEYYDTRTRVIRVTFARLEEDKDERYNQLRKYDEFLRKVLRILPSPHYSIVLTSTTNNLVHPVPRSIMENSPKRFNIFNSIINHESREEEYERNDSRFQVPEPQWNEDKNTINRYLRNRKKDEIHFWRNKELWAKNESLVYTVGIMVTTLFLKSFAGLFFRPRSPIIGESKKNS